MYNKIKSKMAVFMAVIMLVTALTFTATSSVSAAEPDDTVYKNGVVEYVIGTTNTTSIAGYEINMSYDNTIASAVDVQNMVELPGGEFMFSNKDIYGNYKRTVFAFDTGYYGVPLEAGQGIVKVVFEINDTTNIGDIVISDTSEFYNGAYVTCDYGSGDLVASFNILDYGDVPEPPEEPTTEEPTEAPTEEPPTEEPTEEPTTEAPTEEPTTEAPTEEPTTEAPTEEPPTEAPTEEPSTEAPTEEPPTEAPTEEPTTEAPTEEPTTEAPAEEPTTEEPPVQTLSVSATSNMFDTATQTIDAGESVTINYTFNDAQKVDSYLWTLDYDTNKLELTGISTPGSASSVAIDTSVPGQVRAGASDAITPFSYAAGDDFVTFVFTAIDSGETTVTLNVTDFLVHEDQEPTTEAPTEELTEEPTTEVPTEEPTTEAPTEDPTAGEPDVKPTGSDTSTDGGDNPDTTGTTGTTDTADTTGNNTNPGGPATADEPQAPADTGGKQLDSTTTTGTNTSSGGSGAVQTGQTSTAFVLLLLLSLAAALVAVVSRRKQKKE